MLFSLKAHSFNMYNNVFINSSEMLYIVISNTLLIIYTEMILDCDWSISVQFIPNRSEKSVTRVQKSVTRVQKSVTRVQKSVTTVQNVVTTVQNFVINLFD